VLRRRRAECDHHEANRATSERRSRRRAPRVSASLRAGKAVSRATEEETLLSEYLVDTDVLSEPRKVKPDDDVVSWLRAHEGNLFTSAVVIGEIAWGIERLPHSAKRRELTQWLHGRVLAAMAGR